MVSPVALTFRGTVSTLSPSVAYKKSSGDSLSLSSSSTKTSSGDYTQGIKEFGEALTKIGDRISFDNAMKENQKRINNTLSKCAEIDEMCNSKEFQRIKYPQAQEYVNELKDQNEDVAFFNEDSKTAGLFDESGNLKVLKLHLHLADTQVYIDMDTGNTIYKERSLASYPMREELYFDSKTAMPLYERTHADVDAYDEALTTIYDQNNGLPLSESKGTYFSSEKTKLFYPDTQLLLYKKIDDCYYIDHDDEPKRNFREGHKYDLKGFEIK